MNITETSPLAVTEPTPAAPDLWVFKKDRLDTSPSLVRLSELTESDAYHLSFGEHGMTENRQCYLGANLFPISGDEKHARHQEEILPELSSSTLTGVPHYCLFRFECDGPNDVPREEAIRIACVNMTRALEILSDLPDSPIPKLESPENSFVFFCTGGRSTYAFALHVSPEARTDWDKGAKSMCEEINRRAGEKLIDTAPYGRVKSPWRMPYSQHTSGGYFNPIKYEWVAKGNVAAIMDRCSEPWTETPVADAIGMMDIQGTRRKSWRVYDSLQAWAERAEIVAAAHAVNKPPPLPRSSDYDEKWMRIADEQGWLTHREERPVRTASGTHERKPLWKLSVCPFCHNTGHAWLTHTGRLKCYGGSCASDPDEGLPPYGKDGWIVQLGLGDGSAETEEQGDEVIPSDAPDTSQWQSLEDARAELDDAVTEALHTNGVHLIRAAPGTGKTTAAIKAAAKRLRECGETNTAIIIASPTKQHRDDLVTQARDAGGVEVCKLVGRDETTCMRNAECAAVSARGYQPRAVVCQRCSFAPWHTDNTDADCLYMGAMETALNSKEPRLIFCCYEQVPLVLDKLKEKKCQVISLVLDEDPHRFFLQPVVLTKSDLDCSFPSSESAHRKLLTDHAEAIRLSQARMYGKEFCGALGRAFGFMDLMPEKGRRLTGPVLCRVLQFEEGVVTTADELFGVAPSIDGLDQPIEHVLDAAVRATRRRIMAQGDTKPEDLGRTIHAAMPRVAGAIRREYRRYRAGEERWNSRIVVRQTDGEPELHAILPAEMPALPDNVLVLDATGDAERLRSVMPGNPEIRVREIHARQLWADRVWVRTSGGRRASQGEKRPRLLDYIRRAVDENIPQDARTLVVTHGNALDRSWEEACARAIREDHDGEVVARHYHELRGLNEYEEFDAILTIGDNEPNPHGFLEMVSAIYADNEPLGLEMEKADGSWVYSDPRIAAWHRLHTTDELAQVAHRIRPIINEGRIHVHIGRRHPLAELGCPSRIIKPRRWDADAVTEQIRIFLETHGWWANFVAEAVGILARKDEAVPARPFDRVVARMFGGEFEPVSRAYRERQFRTIASRALTGPRQRMDDVALALHGLARFYFHGDRNRLMGDLEKIKLELSRVAEVCA
ncbi:MAG: hypothetical protein GXP25_15895 [Planctomycetes bacterium]|nr:hypothetical protein [Planctomycetota bacterium]